MVQIAMFILMVYMVYTSSKVYTLICKCIIYSSIFKSEGIFTSPNYPSPYSNAKRQYRCLLYFFLGNPLQIVKITFVDLDIAGRSLETGICETDYLRIYRLNSISPVLMSPTMHIDIDDHTHPKLSYSQESSVLCGNISHMRRGTENYFYSSQNILVFKFYITKAIIHADQPRSRGFQGIFNFISKDKFLNKGIQMKDTSCSYKYFSYNGSKSGNVYSPDYPGNYPCNAYCQYLFYADRGEHVYLNIEHASLEPSNMSCINVEDTLRIYDGLSDMSPLIDTLCSNTNYHKDYRSSGHQMLIIFKTNSKTVDQGFHASYNFQRDDQITDLEFSAMNCDKTVSSSVSPNGTINSPNYPNPYPPRIQCTYHFVGRGKERVQIKFLDFDLYHPYKDPNHCLDVDVVEIATRNDDEQSVIDEFCGQTSPPSVLSSGHTLTIDFRGYTSGDVRGFKIAYSFITDFGIHTGKQDESYACAFEYNSLQGSNGTFSSPNFPGLYPRDTECYYLFYGVPEEKVRIIFPYFDVEGIFPCIGNTESDYIELSNFRSVDRKFPRYCGGNKPPPIESDNNFFRITFKTNSLFDATGFEAHYQFYRPVEDRIQYNYPNASSRIPTGILNLILAILLSFLSSVNPC